ncbi:hypothetical protein EAV90_14965 [Bradyrhizobium vignae]|nr:hypothetical protein EAV90_14965 [Bradyrhizobium vignae]
MDLRKGVVAAIEGGMSRNQAAKQFGIAISTAIGWMHRSRRPAALSQARWALTNRRRFRETMRSGYRNGSRTAISPYPGSLPRAECLRGEGLALSDEANLDRLYAAMIDLLV